MEKLLIVSCLTDDCYTKTSEYLLKNQLDAVKAGVEKYKGMVGAAEVLYMLPEGSDSYGLECVAYGKPSPTGDNPYSCVQQLVGNLPRPMIQDDYVAVYNGKEVMVLTPEAAMIIANGADTKYITVNGEVKAVKVGTPLSEVVDASAAKAVLLGGFKGTFVLPSALADQKVEQVALCNSINVYGKETCMVDLMAKHMNAAWQNTCGKCVMCREGSLQFKTILEDMPAGKSKAGDIELLKDVGPLVKIGAYCPYGQNMPQPMLSAMELFADEFEAHVKKKQCPANVCFQKGDTYYIDPELCTGCEDCVDECDFTAIEGKKKFIHMIDQDMCEHCGKCVDACDEGAILKADGKLPKLPKKLTRVGKF